MNPSRRFQWLEWPGREFPFYTGTPTLGARQWLIVLAMLVGGFAALVLPMAWPLGAVGKLLPAVLMVALPLLGLHLVAPGQWRALFGPVGWRELRWMVAFAALNIVVSLGVALLIQPFSGLQPNQAFSLLERATTAEALLFFARTVPQLLGEELVTVLPFLALMALLSQTLGMARKPAIVLTWLLSALLFGLLHLPTYGWNVLQCVLIIGTARLVLTLPWIMSKNLWVSTGAHILNDWTLFLLAVLASRLSA